MRRTKKNEKQTKKGRNRECVEAPNFISIKSDKEGENTRGQGKEDTSV